MPDRAASHRQRRRRRGAHRVPGWWPRPRRRSCRARVARAIGLPLATALCVLAIVLVFVPAVVA